jgi:hypothetical protein
VIRTPYGIQSERTYIPSQPVRDAGYLRFIRGLPCSCCESQRGIEAAHMGPHGMGQKSSDLSAIPLCRKHHRTGADSYHELGPVAFAEAHPKLDVTRLIVRLNAAYELIQRRKSA